MSINYDEREFLKLKFRDQLLYIFKVTVTDQFSNDMFSLSKFVSRLKVGELQHKEQKLPTFAAV